MYCIYPYCFAELPPFCAVLLVLVLNDVILWKWSVLPLFKRKRWLIFRVKMVGMRMQPGYKGRVREYGHTLITTRGKEMEPWTHSSKRAAENKVSNHSPVILLRAWLYPHPSYFDPEIWGSLSKLLVTEPTCTQCHLLDKHHQWNTVKA